MKSIIMGACSISDPSTALKLRPLISPLDFTRGGELVEPLGAVSPSTLLRTVSLSNGLSNGSGSTLSMPRAPVLCGGATAEGGEARGSRRVDTETGEGYKLARHGILIPSGDSKALAEALLFVLGDKTLTMVIAERARKHVLQKYSLERLVKDMEALYEGLVRS